MLKKLRGKTGEICSLSFQNLQRIITLEDKGVVEVGNERNKLYYGGTLVLSHVLVRVWVSFQYNSICY